MAGRDQYIVLGIARDETTEGIRAAYRGLVARHARTPSDAPRVREIVDAYGILSDPAQRERYDATLARPRAGVAPKRQWLETEPGVAPLFAEPLSAPARFGAIHPSAEELMARLRRAATGIGNPKGGHVDEVHVEVLLTPAEAARGGTFDVGVPVPRWCSACGGSGEDWYGRCPACGGGGIVEREALVRSRVRGLRHDTTLVFSLRDLGLVDSALEVHVRIAPWRAVG
jgi:DnaJ-class molecular chaperone